MQRYVSASVNAKYFLECVTSCLMDKMHREPSEREFWDFVITMYFENDVFSRNCKFWRTMKAFADRQSIARSANIWKLTFENADKNSVRTVILYLQDEKLKRQAEREERKNDEYKAALDEFNRFARSISDIMDALGTLFTEDSFKLPITFEVIQEVLVMQVRDIWWVYVGIALAIFLMMTSRNLNDYRGMEHGSARWADKYDERMFTDKTGIPCGDNFYVTLENPEHMTDGTVVAVGNVPGAVIVATKKVVTAVAKAVQTAAIGSTGSVPQKR